MLYKVKIKKVDGLIWRKISNIENDWILSEYVPNFPKRVVVDKDKNNYDINLNDNIVVFSKERPNSIKESRVKFDVKYKKINGLFWHTIKNCNVDTLMYPETKTPIRVFITDTGERWEIPFLHYEFKFDKNKLLAIQDIMEQESGQKIDAIK